MEQETAHFYWPPMICSATKWISRTPHRRYEDHYHQWHWKDKHPSQKKQDRSERNRQKALQEWLERLSDDRGPLFKGVNRAQKITKAFGAGQINHIYKRLAARANLDEELIEKISVHSMRVEHAQDLVISGASVQHIMSKGR